jgi:hypothetical protein
LENIIRQLRDYFFVQFSGFGPYIIGTKPLLRNRSGYSLSLGCGQLLGCDLSDVGVIKLFLYLFLDKKKPVYLSWKTGFLFLN